MNGRINVLRSTAVFVLFMFMCSLLPVGTANAYDYTETVIYDNSGTPKILSSGDITLNTGDTISTDYAKGHGVNVSGDLGYANINSVDITTQYSPSYAGNSAYGVYVHDGASADITGGTKITTTGVYGYGVYAHKGASVDITGGSITTSGFGAIGVNASYNSSADIANTTITTGGSADGVSVHHNSSADITNTTIITTDEGARGVFAYEDGNADITGGSITTSGPNSSALAVLRNAHITADGTDITVNGDSFVFGIDRGTSSITVKNVAPVNPAGKLLEALFVDTGTFIAENSTLKGDTELVEEGVLNMSLTKNTTLTGGANTTFIEPMFYLDPKINMYIDATSTWNVTKDSAMHGVLDNAGTIKFGSNVAEGAKKVNVSDYNGAAGSKLFMKTDINTAADMDQILASNTAKGKSDIMIFNTANAGVEKSAPLLRGANGGGSNLTLSNPDEIENGVKYIHAGAWRYSLVKETTGTTEEWVLKRGDLIPPKPPTPDPDPDDPEPLRPIGLTTTGQAIVAAAFLHDVWYTETNTWNSRMGIYRDNLWNGGLWFTGVRNREDFDHEHDNTVADRQDFTTGTIGFDKKYEMKNGTFWGGVMAGFGRTDNTLLGGIGDVDMDSYHMSLYGVYRSNSGFYVNGIVKYNDYRSELDIHRPDNFSKYVLGFDQIHGEWSQDGLGISIQAGKRFDFAGGNGWYWEPQAQFSWNRVFAADYRTDSGIDVAIDDMDYIRLRGGVVLGRSWTLKNGTLLDLYADASIIHDFDADTNVTMSGGTYSSTLGGTWGIYGIGANWQFKPGQFFHARFQYSDGEPFTEPFAVYLGFSFEM